MFFGFSQKAVIGDLMKVISMEVIRIEVTLL